MLKRFLIVSFVFILFSSREAFPEARNERVKGPITVTSESLTADNKAHAAFFEKNVIAKTGDMTMYADRMTVFYKPDGGDVTRIEASGNVKLVRDTKMITSQSAVYQADEDKIIFTGEPRAMDGENMVTGSIMTYFVAEDRSYVEKSKVFLKNRKER